MDEAETYVRHVLCDSCSGSVSEAVLMSGTQEKDFGRLA